MQPVCVYSGRCTGLNAATGLPNPGIGGTCSNAPSGYSLAPLGMLCKVKRPDGSYTDIWYNSAGGLAQVVNAAESAIPERTDFGYTLFGFFADRVGRRPAFVVYVLTKNLTKPAA